MSNSDAIRLVPIMPIPLLVNKGKHRYELLAWMEKMYEKTFMIVKTLKPFESHTHGIPRDESICIVSNEVVAYDQIQEYKQAVLYWSEGYYIHKGCRTYKEEGNK